MAKGYFSHISFPVVCLTEVVVVVVVVCLTEVVCQIKHLVTITPVTFPNGIPDDFEPDKYGYKLKSKYVFLSKNLFVILPLIFSLFPPFLPSFPFFYPFCPSFLFPFIIFFPLKKNEKYISLA